VKLSSEVAALHVDLLYLLSDVLSERQRAVAELYIADNMFKVDIAIALGCSRSTVYRDIRVIEKYIGHFKKEWGMLDE
jgi:predicted DNA-binding protein YlxM (UPF0122 family)